MAQRNERPLAGLVQDIRTIKNIIVPDAPDRADILTPYRAPIADMQFALRELAGIESVSQLPGFSEAAGSLDAILEEAAHFATGVLDPLNASGDRTGATWKDGEVAMPAGFKAAYKQFADAGWIGLPVPEEYGGQALPQLLLGPTLEMWNAANVGFANGPLLNQGAIEAIELCGNSAQKQRYLTNLVSGKWTGTMCLTEPQAGSDLAQVATRAVPAADGSYRLTGQKIFITFGEHDMAENIIHLVLARLPDAPPGIKGISLFIVPKYLVREDGTLGERNDVACTGIEHKLGINANPTCTLQYGERGGAVGELVGEANRGLEYMFVMMNAARFSVGVQAIGIADRAYQQALAYANERVQSRDAGSTGTEAVRIIQHPDVRRMLLWCKAQIEAMRALAYVTAASLDFASAAPDEAARKRHRAFVEFMIPIVKGWCTETAVDVASTALQVFGGMGYVEETGIAQQYRDVRITTIYEGTTGIQALDLVGRKVLRDMGAVARTILADMAACANEAAASTNEDVRAIAAGFAKGVSTLGDVSQFVGLSGLEDLHKALACSVPYLKLWGIVAGGWQMLRAASSAARKIEEGAAGLDFYRAKVATARFYTTHVLSMSAWLKVQIVQGSADVTAFPEAAFTA